jgi:hypothetical protein
MTEEAFFEPYPRSLTKLRDEVGGVDPKDLPVVWELLNELAERTFYRSRTASDLEKATLKEALRALGAHSGSLAIHALNDLFFADKAAPVPPELVEKLRSVTLKSIREDLKSIVPSIVAGTDR